MISIISIVSIVSIVSSISFISSIRVNGAEGCLASFLYRFFSLLQTQLLQNLDGLLDAQGATSRLPFLPGFVELHLGVLRY